MFLDLLKLNPPPMTTEHHKKFTLPCRKKMICPQQKKKNYFPKLSLIVTTLSEHLIVNNYRLKIEEEKVKKREIRDKQDKLFLPYLPNFQRD